MWVSRNIQCSDGDEASLGPHNNSRIAIHEPTARYKVECFLGGAWSVGSRVREREKKEGAIVLMPPPSPLSGGHFPLPENSPNDTSLSEHPLRHEKHPNDLGIDLKVHLFLLT